MMIQRELPPKVFPVTAEFRPSLAFKVMTTAEYRKEWARWHHFRNYKERTGSPLCYVVPACVNLEMQALRNYASRMHRIVTRWDLTEEPK
jgi:hypothetical protein